MNGHPLHRPRLPPHRAARRLLRPDIADIRGNHLRNRRHAADLSDVVRLRLEVLATHGIQRAQIYSVRVF